MKITVVATLLGMTSLAHAAFKVDLAPTDQLQVFGSYPTPCGDAGFGAIYFGARITFTATGADRAANDLGYAAGREDLVLELIVVDSYDTGCNLVETAYIGASEEIHATRTDGTRVDATLCADPGGQSTTATCPNPFTFDGNHFRIQGQILATDGPGAVIDVVGSGVGEPRMVTHGQITLDSFHEMMFSGTPGDWDREVIDLVFDELGTYAGHALARDTTVHLTGTVNGQVVTGGGDYLSGDSHITSSTFAGLLPVVGGLLFVPIF
jgi:hypothetical protein